MQHFLGISLHFPILSLIMEITITHGMGVLSMTKIYNAKTFLEADQIIATLQSQHISAEKREINDMNVITGKTETAFEIYVSEEDSETAVKCIEQMSVSDTNTSG